MSGDNGLERPPTERFSDRVGPYMRYRPDYPDEIFTLLKSEGYLMVGTKVADVGAGTGIFTRQLLENGCEVWAIEPNDSMRSVADAQLGRRNAFHGIAASAESTPLSDGTVDLVAAAQAFHWFEPEAARREFLRILGTPPRATFIWNVRDTEASEFSEELEALIERHATDYGAVIDRLEAAREALEPFFGGPQGAGYDKKSYDHRQTLDKDGLEGRLLSCPHLPQPNDEGYEAMAEEVGELYEAHEQGGEVTIPYDTEVVYGTID